MEQVKKINWEALKHEYGVDGQRLLPWGNNLNPFPFGGAYCIARAETDTFKHINEPLDEKEMFIVISGKAYLVIEDNELIINKGDVVYIEEGKSHYIKNPFNEDFHFYALWWNNEIIENYIKKN